MTEYAHPLQIGSLTGLPTITVRDCCHLKIEYPEGRWWLCTRPVGTTDHRITIERWRKHLGVWRIDQVFEDRIYEDKTLS